MRVIVLGNDHTNSLGVVQCLGRSGFKPIVFVWGVKSGLVKKSKYCYSFYSSNNVYECIELMKQLYGDNIEKIPVIPCCDLAALALEQNNKTLKSSFIFGYSKLYTLQELAEKEVQVRIASKAGFNVPKTWNLEEKRYVPQGVTYPCLIKPLISSKGAKGDIYVCQSDTDLIEKLGLLKHTKQVLLQEYIERDYEISILGCSLKNGEVVIPVVENKLTLYPKNVGLECLANLQPLRDSNIIQCITRFLNTIGYVGLFSVEMMHSKKNNKFYFTEINLRNDGANSFVYKYGVNLLQNHIEDLTNKPISSYDHFNPGYYIWEMHHFQSLLHGDINPIRWMKEIFKSNGFLTYFKEDKRPFFHQFANSMLHLFRITRIEHY